MEWEKERVWALAPVDTTRRRSRSIEHISETSLDCLDRVRRYGFIILVFSEKIKINTYHVEA